MDMGNMCAKFRTNDNCNAMLQFFLSELFFYKTVEDPLVSPLWGKRGKKVFKGLFVHAAVRGGACAFTLKIVSMLIKNSSRDYRASISHRINPRPPRFVLGKAGEYR